jgi:hypothetical protein
MNDIVYFGLPLCSHQSIAAVLVMIMFLAGAPKLLRVLVSRQESLLYSEHVCPCELALGLPPNGNLKNALKSQKYCNARNASSRL